jgi:hypothetical protein
MTRTTLTPEGKVKKRIKEILKAHGIFHFSPSMGAYSGKAGIPDIITCIRGYLVGIEAKADPMKAPSKFQMLRMSEIRQSGGLTLLIHSGNLDEFELLIKEVETKPIRETIWASDLYFRENWNDDEVA